jgi:biotin--protein ligase
MASKQLAEELRCYARSEKHLRPFQTWLSGTTPALPSATVLDAASAPPSSADDSAADAHDTRVMQTQLFPLLKTHTLAGVVLFSPAMASTQTFLHDTLRPTPPPGVLCYTEHQLQGKGRGSNTWFSPEGCLTFSFNSSFVDGNTLPFVQYLVSLAIIRAVEVVNPSESGKASPVRIKWPNDIYVDTVKIGGMLCQSEYRDGKFNVTTGTF